MKKKKRKSAKSSRSVHLLPPTHERAIVLQQNTEILSTPNPGSFPATFISFRGVHEKCQTKVI